ncbi:MAG: molybdopterin cofactor-binding domain-containing protein [Candidatus Eisenbacteria bacterium]
MNPNVEQSRTTATEATEILLRLRVNRRDVSVAARPNATLLSVLRDTLQMTGTKCGCGEGDCGACTVLLDGEQVNSCLFLAAEAQGTEITTIEGLSPNGALHPVQKAFVETGSIQCGFCSPGMILSAKALLDRNPDPTDEEIRNALAGNLCRCTGYVRILEAVRRVAHPELPRRVEEGESDDTFSVVGKSVPKKDAADKATGKATYTGDFRLPGMLRGKLLGSPHPHAKILSVDTSEAEALPGVHAVITAKDVPDVPYGVSPARYDEQVLAGDRVRHVGDAVAAVAAEDDDTAERALELIRVEYEILPGVFGIEEALDPGAPQLHDAYPRNINTEIHHDFGDVDKAFAEADLVREDVFRGQRAMQIPLEPHVSLARVESDGRITIWTANQAPHYVQHQLSRVLDVPMGRIRVVKPAMGGGFGGKAEATSLDFCSVILAKKTGRPVLMEFSRKETFLHGRGRHAQVIRLKTGVRKDGTLLAVQADITLDGGAYTSFGIITSYYSGVMLTTPYRLPNFRFDGKRVYTNLPACGAMRGNGTPQPRFAFESQLDLIAADLGLDPIELRRRNALHTNDLTVNEFQITSCEFQQCLDLVEERSGWKEKRGKLPFGKGIGIACGCFISGAGYPIYRSSFPHSSAIVRLSEDGTSAMVFAGAPDIGQGSDTVLCQMAAEELGLRYEDVSIISSDSAVTPTDLGAYASRITYFAGNAVRDAAAAARRAVAEVVAEEWGLPVEEVSFRNGHFHSPDGSRTRSIQEAAALAFGRRGPVVGKGEYSPPPLGGKFKGAPIGTSPAYSFCAQVAEVEVDTETGTVRVTDFYDAHDCGTVINPMNLHGQVEGSLVMGMGESLWEEVIHKDGRIVNPNLHDYLIPTAADAPRIHSFVVKSYDPGGPFGAKEVGEGASLPVMGAVANAVANAIGVRLTELPITPEKVLRALGKIPPDAEGPGTAVCRL